MKLNFQLFVLLLLLTRTCSSQEKTELVSADFILYKGINNPIKVIDNSRLLSSHEYSVEVDWGTYIKTDSCLWIKPSGNHGVHIVIKDKAEKVLLNKNFPSYPISNIKLTLDGKYRGGNFAIQTLLLAKRIVPICEIPVYVGRIEVLTYQISITNGNEISVLNCSGPLISDTVKSLFSKIIHPYRIEFSSFSFKIDEFIERDNDCSMTFFSD